MDLDSLPVGPLSMSALVALEPQALRRLLKGGLRRGLSTPDLERLFLDEWSCPLDSELATHLLQALEARGWFCRHGDCWKTHLG